MSVFGAIYCVYLAKQVTYFMEVGLQLIYEHVEPCLENMISIYIYIYKFT